MPSSKDNGGIISLMDKLITLSRSRQPGHFPKTCFRTQQGQILKWSKKKRRDGQSGRFEKLTIEIFQPDTNPTFKSEVLSKSIEVENGERVNKKNKQR